MLTVLALYLAACGADQTYPPLSDLEWFPPPAVVHCQRALAAQHQEWLNGQLEIESWRREQIGQWLYVADLHSRPWGFLHYAQDSSDILYRRKCLFWLRRRIGFQNYYSGIMPPSVPVYLFREVEY